MLQNQSEVRQTEMSKATGSLFSAIDVLTERVDVLRSRLACVSMPKPKNSKKDNQAVQSYPPLIQEIRTAEEKLQKLYTIVSDMLDDLEV